MAGTSTNGTVRKTREESRRHRRALREQRRLIQAQTDLAETIHRRQLVEMFFGVGDPDGFWSGADMLDRSLFSGIYPSQNFGVPPTTPSDRRHGQKWPFWRTEVELASLRQRSRIIIGSNHYAQSIENNVVNYVMGTGCSYKAMSKELSPTAQDDDEHDAEADDYTRDLVATFQDWLDAFTARNRWNDVADIHGDGVIAESRERESCRRVIHDGEAFLWLWFHPDGTTDIRWVEPECVGLCPGGESYEDGWSFGKQHVMRPHEDVEAILAYHVLSQDISTNKSGWAEVVDAKNVVHIMVPGTPSSIARGTPMFSYATAEAFERAVKLERNIAAGTMFRAATAEIWQHHYGTQSQIGTMVQQLASGQVQDPATGNTVNQERMHPATVRRIPKGIENVRLPEDYSDRYIAALQMELRACGSPFSAPEYWSGMTDNGNYSNLETASAPAVKMGQAWQRHFKAAFLRVLWKAARWAVQCEILPPAVLTLCDIQCEAPVVLHRNELETTQQRQIESQAKILSPQTWCQETGRDWETEAANWQEFDEQFGQQGMPLGLPGGPDADQPPEPALPDGDALPAGFGESLLEALQEKGFTGTVKDRLGRQVHFVNGKRVKAGAKPSATSRDPRAPHDAYHATRKANRASKHAYRNPSHDSLRRAADAHRKAAQASHKAGDAITAGKHERLAAGFDKRRKRLPSGEARESTTQILAVPDIRQKDHYSCGACAAMATGRYFGVGPDTLGDWKQALGTSLAKSTDPRRIELFLRGLGLETEARDQLNVGDLELYVQKGWPVIVCVQDYGNRRAAGASFAYGHYLTVIGVLGGSVVCQDSSEENVLEPDAHSIQTPGRVIIDGATFTRVWHDQAEDGTKFIRFGIAVGPLG